MLNFKLFLLALSFYTRLPAPKQQDYTKLSQASIYLPLVGWLVGGLSALCFFSTSLIWNQSTAVILSLIFSILLTGAFHEDGFADACDGFGGGYGKANILAIMKDSQIGVYGAIGLLLLFALKISLLNSFSLSSVPAVLIAGHSISRFQPLLIMWRYDYARIDNSKTGAAMYQPSDAELLFTGLIAIIPMLLLPPVCMVSIAIVFLVNWRLACYFQNHIGGYTGDCLGASQQVAETIFYLGVSALWTFT